MTDEVIEEKVEENADESTESTAGEDTDVSKEETKEKSGVLDAPDEDVKAASDWPEDWREKLAGDDEKLLNKMKRYNSPNDFSKAYKELLGATGNMKKPLPENPSEEELKAYREDNNIPAEVSGYDLTLENGMVIGEEDKPLVDQFLSDMHANNMPQDVVSSALNAYYKMQDVELSQRAEAEKAAKKEAVEELRSEWGPEFTANKNMIEAYIERHGELGQVLANARDSEGRALFNNPEYVKWLANIVSTTDPAATVIRDMGGSPSGLQDRISEIQDIIRNDPDRYWSGEEGSKLQAELQKLTAIRDKTKAA